MQLDFSRHGQARVIAMALFGIVLTMAAALATVAYTTQFMTEEPRALSFAAAIILPILLAGPIFYVFASKLRALAIAHRELTIIASQDSLTTCLNRGAFVTLVDAYLSQANALSPVTGGLLMVDADHFKTINDRFGHSTGDQALKLIATTIKSVLRSTDLIGRVGGEEFAVFLPAADLTYAERIASRIVTTVGRAEFSPGGQPVPLSVSVGGTAFIGPVAFNALFSEADQRLYVAKRLGRNRTVFGPVIGGGVQAA